RLAALTNAPLQRIGLSATQKPIELVAEFLVGRRCSSRGNEADEPATAHEFQDGALSIEPSNGRSSQPRYLGSCNARKPDPDCVIIDAGYKRKLDLAIEVPGSPLEAVMSNEVWAEVYNRIAELIEQHKTTLVFVNTRRLAERVTHHLCERLGKEKVTSHHGSLSAKLRLDAEDRLKRGD